MALSICRDCGRSAERDGIAVHRLNVGELPAVWQCDDCYARPVDPAVRDILDAVEEARRLGRVGEEEG
jgi:hypothetical protein